MKKPTEDHGIMSRLPEDGKFWDDLTDRVVLEAAPSLQPAAVSAASGGQP